MDTVVPPPIATRRLSPEESPIPEHHSILAYWNGLRGKRIAPAWKEFDLSNLSGKILPWTAVVDISDDGRSMIYRFWGSQLTAYRGRDYTGCSPLEIPPLELGQFIVDSYLTTASDKLPCLDIEEYLSPMGRKGAKSVLRLPLSDDGEIINKVVANMVFDISYSGEDVLKFFERVNT